MAPNGDGVGSRRKSSSNFSRPSRLSTNSLYRTLSDITLLSKEAAASAARGRGDHQNTKELQAISEVEDVKCECCGMSEECTPEYIERVRDKFMGKWVCGLCSEAVKEEMDKDGGKSKEEAVTAHMSACVRFNKFGRAYPALFQAEAMREMLRKRAKSLSPKVQNKKGGISRTTSCIPAINNLQVTNY